MLLSHLSHPLLSLLCLYSCSANRFIGIIFLDSIYMHSIQFSHSVMSDSLLPHGLQHTRPPCPSPSPGACLNTCPLNQWCHPTVSSPVVPLSSCLHSFPASGSFPMSQFFISGGQSIGVSASASVLPMNIQYLFPLGLTGLIFSQSKIWSTCSPNKTYVWIDNICFSLSDLLHSV